MGMYDNANSPVHLFSEGSLCWPIHNICSCIFRNRVVFDTARQQGDLNFDYDNAVKVGTYCYAANCLFINGVHGAHVLVKVH